MAWCLLSGCVSALLLQTSLTLAAVLMNKDLRLSTVYEFRVRVRLLFHPAAQHPSGWSEFFENEMHRTLSEESDPAPPVEAEMPDHPFATVPDGRDTPAVVSMADTGPHCDLLPAPYHLHLIWGSLDPRQRVVRHPEWTLSMEVTCLLSFRTKGSQVFRKVSFSVSGAACQGQEKVFARLEDSHHWLRTPLWWSLQ